MPGSTSQIRLLLVEDVPQVAQYVRGLLNAQQAIKLVDVVTDGGRVAAQVQQLRPDVIVVDWLLQGRTKGHRVVEILREGGLHIPVIALTVPQSPVEPDPKAGIAAVISMPFSGFELVNVVNAVHAAASATRRRRTARASSRSSRRRAASARQRSRSTSPSRSPRRAIEPA